MQTNNTLVPKQEIPFRPREFFLGEARREQPGKKDKGEKLNLKFFHNPGFPEIIRSRFGENDSIADVGRMSFETLNNKVFVENDTKIFSQNGRDFSVTLAELLWTWKHMLQRLAQGKHVRLQRTGLANVWSVRDGDLSFNAFFCMYDKSRSVNNVYAHTKENGIWMPDHRFFLKY